MTDDGGDYDEVKQVTIGFNAVSRLLTKRVDAVPGVLERRGRRAQGARAATRRSSASRTTARRAYPEVVLVTARKTLGRQARRDRGARWRRSAPGVATTRARPRRGGRTDREGRRDRRHRLVRAQLDAVLPMFADGLKLDRARARRLGGLRRAHRAREDAPRRRAKTFDFTPLNGEAPERCHRPGCHRSILVAALRPPPGLQSRVWRAIGPPAGRYVLTVRRINHVYD